MSITSPPRPPRPDGGLDRDELEALVEALIEEARQRARRRRRRRGAYVAAAVLAGAGLYFGLQRGGGATGAPVAVASNGAAVSTRAPGRWGPAYGPEGGGAYTVAVAPSGPHVVYVGTGRGVYRSTSGGNRWLHTALSPPGDRYAGVTSLLVAPRSPGTVYAGINGRWSGGGLYGRAVYKTTNGGRTWHALALQGEPVAITRTAVFAATGGPGKTSRLVRSTDAGRSWQRADAGLPRSYLWALAPAASAPATLYAAMGTRGLFTSPDGGAHWRTAGLAARYGEVTAVAVDPTQPTTVYAATKAGIAGSRDGGRTWRVLNARIAERGPVRWNMQVTALLVDPADTRTLYATTRCAGVFKSTDGGRAWSTANTGLGPQCAWAYALAFDPRAPRILYAADLTRGVFRTGDGGAHWRVANVGLNQASIWTLAVEPHAVYVGAGAVGLFRSDDGGVHWRSLASGLDGVYAVGVDPNDPAHVLAAGSAPAGYGPPDARPISVSTDAGRTWRSVAFGGRWVSAFAISGQTAYAGSASGLGVYGSTDGGRSWRSLGPRGIFAYVQALAIDPADPAVVYAGVQWGSNRGLYKTGDGGATWNRVTGTLAVDVTAVAVDPLDPATVYVASNGEGVYKSTDAGATWQRDDKGLQWRLKARGSRKWITATMPVTALALDPADPAVVYVAAQRGVYRSADAGASWHAFNGDLGDRDVTTLAFDPSGRTLYAGTNSGVVSLRDP